MIDTTIRRDSSGEAPSDASAVLPEARAPASLLLSGITKTYGPTTANEALSFAVAPGEVIALIGANGAGKSTLMRILAGITMPDAGSLAVDGKPVDLARFNPHRARGIGIRIVHQELSLCDSLTVAENFYIEQPDFGGRAPFWHGRYEALARRSIEAIFPESRIDPRAEVGDLPIAQRQMVEIARAAADPKLRVLILDEPTSSLDARRSADLQRFIAALAANGVAVIFISHKLHEVAAIARRVLILRNGRLVHAAAAGGMTIQKMVEIMASEAATALKTAHEHIGGPQGPVLAEIGSPFAPAPLALRAGEIVGLAGLEGSGQPAFLRALHARARGRAAEGLRCHARTAYVSGDRRGEGVFPLWDVLANTSIGRIAAGSAMAWLRPAAERSAAIPWLDAVQLPAERRASPILDLSGGNQQKVLMARALMADADIILLDDPTRGVDVAVKREFYRLIRQAAEQGKLIIWYSSETIEFLECGRVLLFHEGAIRRELDGASISEDGIVSAAFAERIAGSGADKTLHGVKAVRERFFKAVPALILALIFAVIVLLNRNVASLFGISLLANAAVPLVLVALAQMFVVGGSEIDLGIGAFAGLANVLSATLLTTRPALGGGALGLALAAYAMMGLLIQMRAIPAIVVTLGASFIWAGIGYALQPTPGGSAPAWLAAAASWHLAGVPASVLTIIAALLMAAALNAARSGVVLRGFGANPRALVQGGWSAPGTAALRYAVAGGFGLLAGLSMTAINTASDINAGSSYTLLSVAAVVIGGCALSGGKISPGGVVCGALSLSLIGSLLGFLGVSTNYNAAVQGGLLIGILILRETLSRRPR
ncbi:MAG TPA: ATP-binding cassette domain-containing protein [Acetobacteraceae bacterium]|nr:ATP-binding cassette domain-containing protein [Acetobacteraceae bacterium]